MALTRGTFTDSDAKLRELILYISEKSAADPKYGSTKLNKILLAADILSFRKRGRLISGAQYKSLDHGPVPVGMGLILDRMTKEGELAIQLASSYGHLQKRPVNLRRANLAGFDGEDIALLDEVIGDCRDSNARELSDGSHGIAYYLGTKTGKPIPFAAFLFKQRQKITPYHRQKYEKLAKERGW